MADFMVGLHSRNLQDGSENDPTILQVAIVELGMIKETIRQRDNGAEGFEDYRKERLMLGRINNDFFIETKKAALRVKDPKFRERYDRDPGRGHQFEFALELKSIKEKEIDKRNPQSQTPPQE